MYVRANSHFLLNQIQSSYFDTREGMCVLQHMCSRSHLGFWSSKSEYFPSYVCKKSLLLPQVLSHQIHDRFNDKHTWHHHTRRVAFRSYDPTTSLILNRFSYSTFSKHKCFFCTIIVAAIKHRRSAYHQRLTIKPYHHRCPKIILHFI